VRLHPSLALTILTVTILGAVSCAPSVSPVTDERSDRTGPSDFQAEILEDGFVSPSEYERAVLATVECLRDAGVAVAGPAWTVDGRFFLYTFTAEEGDHRALVANDRCFDEYLSDVQEVHAKQTEPTEEELREAAADYARCLRSEGIAEADEAMSVPELQRLAVEAPVPPRCISPLAVVLPPELLGDAGSTPVDSAP
jgi:hypothetical protein